jgi:hypothetical protein
VFLLTDPQPQAWSVRVTDVSHHSPLTACTRSAPARPRRYWCDRLHETSPAVGELRISERVCGPRSAVGYDVADAHAADATVPARSSRGQVVYRRVDTHRRRALRASPPSGGDAGCGRRSHDPAMAVPHDVRDSAPACCGVRSRGGDDAESEGERWAVRTASDSPDPGLLVLAGGAFTMGSTEQRYPADGEGPPRTGRVDASGIARARGEQRRFRGLVAGIGYLTTTERDVWSFVFGGLLPNDFPSVDTRGGRGAVVAAGAAGLLAQTGGRHLRRRWPGEPRSCTCRGRTPGPIAAAMGGTTRPETCGSGADRFGPTRPSARLLPLSRVLLLALPLCGA